MTSSLSTQAKLEAVTAAVVKVVPEIPFWYCNVCRVESWQELPDTTLCDKCKNSGLERRNRPITLEDVLRAIRASDSFRSSPSLDLKCEMIERVVGGFMGAPDEGLWTLGKPLSEQSDETIAFLYDLLCA
jgi:hypothetical protein